MNLYKKITFSSVCLVLFILILELMIRSYFSLASKSSLPYLYGIDSNVKLEITSLRNSDFLIYKYENVINKINKEESISNNNKKLVFSFGGSTTAGYSCSSTSSSWPDELDKSASNLDIMNFGLSGSNSDYALKKLKREISVGNIPNVVLLANWINELDILSEGFDLNEDYFRSYFPKLYNKVRGYKISGIQLFIYRLDKTFTDISLLYLVADYVISNIVTNAMNNEQIVMQQLKRDNDDIFVAVKNYELNLTGVYNMLTKEGCKLIIIRPPICWHIYKNNHNDDYTAWVQRWDDEMKKIIKSFCKNNNIDFIDTQKAYSNNQNISKYFCDGVHQNYDGHKFMANYINTYLITGE